jgi:hypothetical protein
VSSIRVMAVVGAAVMLWSPNVTAQKSLVVGAPRDLARAHEIRVDSIGDGENGIDPDALLEIQEALRRYLQRIKNSSDLRILVAASLSHHACSSGTGLAREPA